MRIEAHLVDLHNKDIYPAALTIKEGRIEKIDRIDELLGESNYIIPGFIDAHVHIESSMIPPAEFARLAVVQGTVATVSDPHEIANVLGIQGVEFMLEEAKKVPFKFCFGAPSCVPATDFETAGAKIDVEGVKQLLARKDIGYLSEMMNFPGVLFENEEVLQKIKAAHDLGKQVDGHAPGLRGEEAKKYFAAGISTDHECFTFEEAEEKALLGVKILIREGSAAKNFDALWPLFDKFPDLLMFCSDDKHPDDLIKGHINQLVARAIQKGCDLFNVLRAACIHPAEHYQLPVGQLRSGDPADFVLLKNLKSFEVTETWINGICVAEDGSSKLPYQRPASPNFFVAKPKQVKDFEINHNDETGLVRIIQVLDGEIVTEFSTGKIDAENDVLKITVVNRYAENAKPAVGFVQGCGLVNGAIASSVAHDSHNIVAVGTSDELLCEAVNEVIRIKGGISAVNENLEIKKSLTADSRIDESGKWISGC